MAGASKWASLSDSIIFQANQSPQEMGYTPGVANWVQQDLAAGKPRMQKFGINLQEIEVTIKCHSMITPFAKLRKDIFDAAFNGTVLSWVYGTGEALGDFVIVKVKEKPKKTDESGKLFVTEFDITLKEYAGPGVAEQTGIDAKKKAFANKQLADSIPSVDVKTVTSISSVTKVSDNIQKVNTNAKKLLTIRDKLQKAKMSIAKAKREFVSVSGKITKAVANINSAVAIAKNIKKGNEISSAASLVGVATNSLELACGNNPTVGQLSGLCNDVSNYAGSLNSVGQAANTVKSWFPSSGF